MKENLKYKQNKEQDKFMKHSNKLIPKLGQKYQTQVLEGRYHSYFPCLHQCT